MGNNNGTPKGGDKPRILVVEDEVLQAMNMKMALEVMGHDVVGVAERSDTALAIAREFKPDIILMDVVLKGSVNGIELASKLFDELGSRIIYVTGNSHLLPPDVDPADVHDKPVSLDELKGIIDRAMG